MSQQLPIKPANILLCSSKDNISNTMKTLIVLGVLCNFSNVISKPGCTSCLSRRISFKNSCGGNFFCRSDSDCGPGCNCSDRRCGRAEYIDESIKNISTKENVQIF